MPNPTISVALIRNEEDERERAKRMIRAYHDEWQASAIFDMLGLPQDTP